jgi:hypothetical protein
MMPPVPTDGHTDEQLRDIITDAVALYRAWLAGDLPGTRAVAGNTPCAACLSVMVANLGLSMALQCEHDLNPDGSYSRQYLRRVTGLLGHIQDSIGPAFDVLRNLTGDDDGGEEQ